MFVQIARRVVKAAAPALSLAAVLAVGACSAHKQLYVDGGYVKLSANPEGPAAAYFKIHGGSEPVVLRDVTAQAAIRVEMHQSMMKDGVMSMKRIDTVDIPAGKTIEFKPGGRHIMLWKVNPQVIAKGKMNFIFIFSNGEKIEADAVIVGANGKLTNPAAHDDTP